MIELSCLCGQARVTIATRPDYVNACNCTLCRKAGAWWAYLPPADVGLAGVTSGYRREDKAEPGAEIRFCAGCGATTHFVLTPEAIARFGDALVGVNMRLADEDALAGMELRYPDGRSWSGEGDFAYVREPRILGPGTGAA